MRAASDGVIAAIEAEVPSGRAVVVGLSLGGYVAIDVADRCPDRVAGLVLAGCSAEPSGIVGAVPSAASPGASTASRRGCWTSRTAATSACATGAPCRPRSSPAGSGPRRAPQALRELAATRYVERLARLWTPVLVVNGALDPVFGPGGDPWAAACRRGRHVVMARAMHLTNLDRPRAFSDARRDVRRRSRRGDLTSGSAVPRPGPRSGRAGTRRYTRGHWSPCSRGSMRVRKAVFPAAGWGTRFLPATKAQPKEMLPLVDKPVIQYAVEEAVAAGIEQVIIVTSSQKRAIEDHFDLNYELEHLLEEKGEIEKLRQVRHISDLAQVAYVRQKEQLGLGHAVLMAKDLIGHEPFAVILPDDVVVADRPCIGQLIHAYNQHHGSVVAVMEVPPEETSRYGVIGGEPVDDGGDPDRTYRVTSMVEKPDPGTAPSNLAVIGRYVLTPKIFDKLEQTQRGAGGEIQLTDAIQALMEEQPVFGYAFEGRRYDAGTTMGWLQASVELALARPDTGSEFREYLRSLDI